MVAVAQVVVVVVVFVFVVGQRSGARERVIECVFVNERSEDPHLTVEVRTREQQIQQ